MPGNSHETDYSDLPHGMTPEANRDVSYAHLLRWAMDHHRVHFIEGFMVVDNGDTSSKPSEAALLELQAKISLEEAGQPLTFPPTDSPDLSEAS